MAFLSRNLTGYNIPVKCIQRLMQAIVFIIIISIYHILFDHNITQRLPKFEDLADRPSKLRNSKDAPNFLRRPKIILYWTQFFGTEDFEVGLGEGPFMNAKCNRNAHKCVTTRDRNWYNESDAIIFHPRDLSISDLPPPEWRRPHQKFIFYNLESPAYTNLTLLEYFKDYFNWTMTYRRDSDIVHIQSYGQLQCIDQDKSSCQCLPFGASCSRNTDSQDETTWSEIVRRKWNSKKKAVAWFVSNCFTDSAREMLVEGLMKYIDIDVYGKCPGALKCGNTMQCNKLLQKHYRFYLSFENSLCPDYVTEKLYRALAYDTIPVVFGGADYSQYLPAGSYINAMDYNSPRALAVHLNKIMEDREKYMSYFRWKSTYTVDLRALQGWCQLCQKLHFDSSERKTYSNISEWWYRTPTNQTCLPLAS